jgi:hypothetical protein
MLCDGHVLSQAPLCYLKLSSRCSRELLGIKPQDAWLIQSEDPFDPASWQRTVQISLAKTEMLA